MKAFRTFDPKSGLIGFLAAIVLVLLTAAAPDRTEKHGHIIAESITIADQNGLALVWIGASEFDSGPHGYVSVYHHNGDHRGSVEIRAGDLTLETPGRLGSRVSLRRALDGRR